MTLDQLKPRLEKIRKRIENATPEMIAKRAAFVPPEQTAAQKGMAHEMMMVRRRHDAVRYAPRS